MSNTQRINIKFCRTLSLVSAYYDSIPHCLLIAKLSAYGVKQESLELVKSYLSERKQRVKINNEYSDWKLLERGVPQGVTYGTDPV